jgi:hypothetical protein
MPITARFRWNRSKATPRVTRRPALLDWSARLTTCPQAIATLTPDDLRLLIGQQIGVEILLRHALALLASDPLVEGDFYPGDLLVAVLRLPPEYWAAHPVQANALQKIAQTARHEDPGLRGAIAGFLSLTDHHTDTGPGQADSSR